MKKSILIVIAVSCLFTSFGSNVFADAIAKIGVVDTQKVIDQVNDTKKYNQDLANEFNPRQTQLLKENQALEDKKKLLANEQSPKKHTAMQNQIIAESQDLQKRAQTFQTELNAARTKALQALGAKIQTAASTIATKAGYTVVIEKRSTLYSANEVDLTDKVIQAVNAAK